MIYKERISDIELKRKLNASGAVLIRGPKACGKTESAKQITKSVLNVDKDENVPALINTAPKRLLVGETPRLIDEWQVQPVLWDYIRHEIDDRQKNAQFILTGSSNPEESAKMHSGAGRFSIVEMRTMSWQELGISSGEISLANLFKGEKIDVVDQATDLDFIIERLIIGGFPTLLNKTIDQATDLNRAYVELLAEVDMSRVSNINRDPIKVRSLLRSLARNTATIVDITSLERDILAKENAGITRPTVYDYLDALNRLMITEEQPTWNTHIRSSHALRKSSKRHFTDVSLAVAASLNIITGTGISYTRTDGINVISLASLGK